MYWIFGVLSFFLAFWASSVVAEDQCAQVEARVIAVEGKVEIQRNATMQWLRAKPNDVLCRNDLLKSGANSQADILILEETKMAVNERTTIRISVPTNKTKTVFSNLIDLFSGEAYFRSRQSRELNIETPIFNAMHEGTEFLVKVSEDQAQLVVFDGVVLASNEQGQVRVKQGQSAQATKGQAPVIGPRIELRDAVQWTLYYPPVIDYSDSAHQLTSSELKPILGLILDNNLTKAFEQLDALPVTEHTADFHIIYASLLLTVGQVKEALEHLNQIEQNSPRQAEVLSLRSIIALAQNDQPNALQLAQQAEQINDTSPSPHIALSYVYQAQFDIDKALQSTRQAAKAGPNNGLAWARLSELELATGNVDDSMQAADQAQRLNPRLSKTNTVLGFARLAALELSEAEQSFRDAIERDPSDPLARLGLGLAKIRQGHIKSGTRDMETAANLSPGNALIRSYLGKAYYEQRRGSIASTEYKIAKHLDPNDPTPWFYDAIYKQTVNRPVEALHDMQKAIELNDNRAVFRSKLLLDEDLAARSSAIGRIYNDLGFGQLGLIEGWKSLNVDPKNYSSHRLLADTYNLLPRYNIARVSELLQSQLFQPLNITPVQPQLAEANLLIFDGLGPASQSFNEFNPLFSRNRFALQASGIVGSNGTFGDEVVHSGLWNKFSYSFGQFHYQNDGFRRNSDLNTNLYNAFIQTKILNYVNLQFEYRRENTNSGDLRQLFNTDFLVENRRQTLNRDSFRLGFNFELNPNINLIGYGIFGKLNRKVKDPAIQSFRSILEAIPFLTQDQVDSLVPFISSDFSQLSSTTEKLKNWSGEIQFIGDWDRFNLIAGISHVNQKKARKVISSSMLSSPLDIELLSMLEQDAQVFINSIASNQTGITPVSENSNRNHTIGYLYSTTEVLRDFNLTLGLSFDHINRDSSQGKILKLNKDYYNPKFGLLWNPFEKTTLRAAWFKSVKRPFASNQTIEPTQVSGISQFFDDPDGARSTRYGFGLDQQITPEFRLGGEMSWRDLSAQRFIIGDSPEIRFVSQSELSHRAYLYWTALQNIAFSAEYFFQSFDRTDSPDRSLLPGVPYKIRTHKVPLTLKYYFSTGFFGSVKGSFISQKVALSNGTNIGFRGDGSFWVADATIGYRLPNRYGIVNLSIKNIFDKKFNIQEENFNIVSSTEGNLIQPVLVPQRTLFAQVTLSF